MSGRAAQNIHGSVMSSNWRARDNTSLNDAVPERRSSRPGWTRSTNSGRHDRRETAATQYTRPSDKAGNDDDTKRAIQDGRRLYVGNLPYMAKVDDVAMLFTASNYTVEHISMSLDPFTGRNPSYCFVDLQDKGQAEEAIQALNGLEVLGRRVKLGPGVPTSARARPSSNSLSTNFQKNRSGSSYDRWKRNDAGDHWRGYGEQGRRVFVGGLPRMSNHYEVEKGIREFFHGYNVECVSKVIVPPTRDRAEPEKRGWNDRYLFVDFASSDEAERAVKAMNGAQSWGVKVRVAKNRLGDSWKVGERQAWDQEQQELQIPSIAQDYTLSHPSFEDGK